jgi:hypothetical protein
MVMLLILILVILNIPTLKARGEQEKVEAVFQASADTYADQENPDSSHGASEVLKVRSLGSKNARTYIFFDISTIPPGATVLSAKLNLYLLNPPASDRTYLCCRLDAAWNEGLLTWNKRPHSVSTYAASSTLSTSSGWVVWDVTAQVQKFLNGIVGYEWDNFGWEVFDSSEDSSVAQEAVFSSKEFSEQDKRPFLIVNFIPPKLNVTMETPSLIAGEWICITIKRLSQDGILVTKGDRMVKADWINIGSLSVKLSTSSGTGVFSLTPGGAAVDRVVIGNGETQTIIYYYDTSVGSHTLSASAENYPPGHYTQGSNQVLVMVDNYPPQIVNITTSPENPVMGDMIKVSAWITDVGSGVKEATLYYSTDGGARWSKVVMSMPADRYEAYIPGQNAFTEISYYVEVIDKSGNTSKSETAKISVGFPMWIYAIVAALIIIIGLIGLMYSRRRKEKK